MRRDEAIRILREHDLELRARGVLHMRIFGSVARDEALAESDVDLLADFDPELGLIRIGGIQHRLEQMLSLPVDLSSADWLRAEVAGCAFAEVMDVF